MLWEFHYCCFRFCVCKENCIIYVFFFRHRRQPWMSLRKTRRQFRITGINTWRIHALGVWMCAASAQNGAILIKILMKCAIHEMEGMLVDTALTFLLLLLLRLHLLVPYAMFRRYVQIEHVIHEKFHIFLMLRFVATQDLIKFSFIFAIIILACFFFWVAFSNHFRIVYVCSAYSTRWVQSTFHLSLLIRTTNASARVYQSRSFFCEVALLAAKSCEHPHWNCLHSHRQCAIIHSQQIHYWQWHRYI